MRGGLEGQDVTPITYEYGFCVFTACLTLYVPSQLKEL